MRRFALQAWDSVSLTDLAHSQTFDRIEHMFDHDLGVLPTRDLLEAAAECRAVASRADARVLECAQVYADRFHPAVCEVRPGRRVRDGGERAVVLGGEGCPEIAEFAVAEFAVVLGVSPGVGRQIIADGLALRHRFPRIWAQVQAGAATPWKACQIVRYCVKLDPCAAAYVDRRVAPIVDTISPYRLDKIVAAAKKQADPGLAETDAAEAAADRGVFVGRGDGHGNKSIYIKAAAAAVNRHDATIAAIADALKTFGDTRPVQHRRAEAVGIICDPAFTQELLAQAQTNTATQPQAAPETDARTEADARLDARVDARAGADAGVDVRDGVDVRAGVDVLAGGAGRRDPGGACGRASGDVRAAATAYAGPEAAPDTTATPCPAPAGDAAVASTEAMTGDRVCSGSGVILRAERVGAACPGGEDDLLFDPQEPVGPVEDPWLEASGPCDPDLPVDPYGSRLADPEARNDDESAMDAAALRALDGRLAQIKQDAYAAGSIRRTDPAGRSRGQVRPGQTEVIVHLTDKTLASGAGVVRAEGIGPLLAGQLAELVGHGPYTVKPVIDLNDAVSVDAYEIPTRIRERVRLIHPVELFPYGTRESSDRIDLDHIEPYDPHGPRGQTSTANLAPLGRFGHRVKTHARGWSVHRVGPSTLEWSTPHGFTFHVDPHGTHRVDPGMDKTSVRRRAGRAGG
ncbi:hypothetical protein [Kribbella sp. NPDC050459]|uniref:hypothetical protein n=1 Tax=Kribbella sp. NPDC050459 TaxID=3155785 RepID=UPI0033FD11CD